MNQLARHDSIRGEFAYQLHRQMETNEKIVVITCDLGYGMFDSIRRDFPDRFFNVGAAEQSGMGIAVGFALMGAIPFIYSITPFLIYRPFETIRTYINHERIPVHLVGSGIGKDYSHDGISHWADDVEDIVTTAFPRTSLYIPVTKQDVADTVKLFVELNQANILLLRR